LRPVNVWPPSAAGAPDAGAPVTCAPFGGVELRVARRIRRVRACLDGPRLDQLEADEAPRVVRQPRVAEQAAESVAIADVALEDDLLARYEPIVRGPRLVATALRIRPRSRVGNL